MECKKRLETEFKNYKRIIAIGDIHGDFDVFIKTLLLGKIIDKNNKWISHDTIVVQMGDQIDSHRAENTAEKIEMGRFSFFKINNLIKKLDKQAIKYKSRIISLLGNHEIMNLLGDFRYTGNNQFLETTNDINSSDVNLRKDRKLYFKNNKEILYDFACNRNVIVKVGSWLFVHGGLILEILEEFNLEQINKITSNWILGKKIKPEHFNKILGFNPKSPLWNRDFGGDDVDCNYLYKTLNFINVNYMVIGHTIQSKGINSLCKKKLWRSDVGLSNRKSSDDTEGIEIIEIVDDGKKINILNYEHFKLYNEILKSRFKKISISNGEIIEDISNPDIIKSGSKIRILNNEFKYLEFYKKN